MIGAKAGEHIDAFCGRLLDIAKSARVSVAGQFNDVVLIARPWDTVNAVKRPWDYQQQRSYFGEVRFQ